MNIKELNIESSLASSNIKLNNNSQDSTRINLKYDTNDNLMNAEVKEFISNLNGSTFSFDLGSSNSSIPLNILTTSFDLNNCISKCSHNGKCKFIYNSFNCICDPDYSGLKCEHDQRPCLNNNNRCLNSIRCENILNETELNVDNNLYLQNYYDYKCHCKENFIGKRCEYKINICENETCSGNGLCIIQNENHVNETIACKCFGIGLYEGKYCEHETTKLVVIQVVKKTTSYIAIIVIITFYCLIFSSDLVNYFMKKKAKTFLKPKNQPDKKKNFKKI